jgi:hypothetical protein
MKCGANCLCGNHLPASIGRITRHGLPAANTPAGTSRVTTLPAPITARAPMLTPGRMIAPRNTRSPSSIERVVQLARQHFFAFGQGRQLKWCIF